MTKYIISTQVWEWYGNEEFTEGRYKPKGSEDFIVELPDTLAYSFDQVAQLWNDQLGRNQMGKAWVCYEFNSIEYYYPPSKATFENDRFVLDFD